MIMESSTGIWAR